MSAEESYLEIFATSDGMIMDSNSFLAEYMYVNKPLLFLTREEQTFNKLGRSIVDTYDQCDGRDYIGIESFFGKHLDYLAKNGCLAGEMIYNDIISLL